MQRILLVLAGLLLLSASVAAREGVALDEVGRDAVVLTEHFAVLEDPSLALKLTDVREPAGAARFVPNRTAGPALNFGFTRSAYWLRLSLRNATGQPVTRLLEVGYPILSDIEFHQPGADGIYRAVTTGVVAPFSTRPYPGREFVFPVTLAPHSEQTVYLRVKSTSALLIPAKLWEPDAFQAHQRSDYAIQAWYFGMASALILFNLLLSLALRDVVYLLYAAFAAGTALTISASNGWGKEFLWPDTALWSDIAVTILGSLTLTALVLFMRRLLGTREAVPRADRLLRSLVAVQLLFAIAVPLAPQAMAVPGAILVTATGWSVLLVALYCAIVQRQRLAMLFVAAYSMWWAGVGLVGLKTITVLPANAITMNGYQIGSALEMLLLALALAYRFNLIRNQATEYVRKANEGLAQRLREREAELTSVHERLREAERRETLIQERRRLMQDMHDGMGSSLTSALRLVERGKMDEAAVAEVLKGCIDDLKLAIDSMEPVDADLLLLLATLRFRLEPRLESTGIAMRWEVQDVPPLPWLDPRNSLHILRILQETITNIIKHANATEVRIGTAADAQGVTVTVTDNGVGFDPKSAMEKGGKGLSIQLRRAHAIGAEISWTSDRSGTRMTLWLPYVRTGDQASREPAPALGRAA